MKKTIAITGTVILALIINSEIYSLALLIVGAGWLVCALFKAMAERGF